MANASTALYPDTVIVYQRALRGKGGPKVHASRYGDRMTLCRCFRWDGWKVKARADLDCPTCLAQITEWEGHNGKD